MSLVIDGDQPWVLGRHQPPYLKTRSGVVGADCIEDSEPPVQLQLFLQQLRLPICVLARVTTVYGILGDRHAANDGHEVHDVIVADVFPAVEH